MVSRQASQRSQHTPNRGRLRARTRAIRKELAALDFVASGTLHHRTKVCGKPTCRCANDPTARHGTYHEWGRMRDGKLVQSTVTAQQVKLLEHGIANLQRAKALLADWERLSETEILHPETNDDGT